MTDAKKTLEQQLADAEQKLAQQTQALELKVSRLREKITKQDVRKSKFINQVLSQWQMDNQQFAAEYDRRLQSVLLTDTDRELFGLPPLPPKQPENEINRITEIMCD